MTVALPVHHLCVITNQNVCTHSISCSQHNVNTPMQNIMSAQNVITGNLKNCLIVKAFLRLSQIYNKHRLRVLKEAVYYDCPQTMFERRK